MLKNLSLQGLCVNDGMKGGTPAILYNLCLGLDKFYSEPIDGLPEPTRRKLHALFIVRWNTLHTPVHSLLHQGQSILPHGT